MKKLLYALLLVLLVPLLSACPFPDEPMPVSEYTPLYMSREQLEKSILKKEAQPIRKPGKIYLYGSYILVNERYKGVHLINNQDPAAPLQVAFIQVPGCIDFAVKNNVMYVDNAVDLVAIDLSNLNQVTVTKRIRNALPALLPPDMFPLDVNEPAPADAVIVGWETKKAR